METTTNITMTECGACGLTSDVNEEMICCDSCDVWYHCRCVGVTSTAKLENKKWFCPEEVCQRKAGEYEKKRQLANIRKTGKNKKVSATDDNSDVSSVKSDSQSGSTLERKLKALEVEQKAKEEEIEIERILREKRMEMDRILMEKKQKMESELRAKEMQQEKRLLEKALQDERAHLEQMKRLRESYQSRMEEVQQEMQECKVDKGGKRKVEDIAKIERTGKPPKTPLRNPEVLSRKLPGKQEREEAPRSKGSSETGDKEEKEAEDSEEESEQTSNSSEEEDSDSESDELEEKLTVNTNKQVPDGLGQPRAGPTKAQLTARSGITKKLPFFSGRPEDWPLFIGSFEASTEACGFSDVENLVRLQESLKGPALESVRGQLLLPKSVPKVIAKLRQLYGRPEQLLQSHLEKVRKLDPPKADKLASFIPFGNAVEQLCDHLEATGLTQHLLNPLLIQELVDKLPAGDKREWVRYKRKRKEVTLRTFTKFLSRIVSEACEANVDLEYRPETRPNNIGRGRQKEKGAVYNHSSWDNPSSSTGDNMQQKPCKVCKRTDHRLRFCQDFRKLTFADRMKVVDRWKLCKICLNDHGNAQCKFKMQCNVGECRQQHSPLLHPVGGAVSLNAHDWTGDSILFRMIPVSVRFGNRVVHTLAFLDEGASVTLVEKALTDRLGAKGTKQPLTIRWTADIIRKESDSERMDLWVSARGAGKNLLLSAVRTVKELLLPEQSLNVAEIADRYSYLRDIPVSSYGSGRPGLLIGLNNLHTIAPMEAKTGKVGEPIAVRSKLGWSVYGPSRGVSTHGDVLLGHHNEVSNQDLHDLLKSHYTLEESVVAVLQESKEDRRAREILEQTTVRVGDRFETGLLWKDDDPQFPNSFPMALRRLKHLEHRLETTPELYQIVRTQIEEYQQKGYAHLATAAELAETEAHKVWYLPLNVVLNPRKPGKVRLVWDAAASVNGVSLNTQLLKGPDMLTSLPGVISRFRERRVAFGGDIREMYHQLRIRSADKQAQRFLFRSTSQEPPKVYVMDVATFGSTSSPCSAQFVKNLNAREFSAQYPEAAAAIINKHYVDDYFDSMDTVEEAACRAKEVKYVHSKAGFEIRNWVSNADEVLGSLGESKTGSIIHFSRDKVTETERVLGIIWNPSRDVFSFSTEHREDLKEYLREGEKPTKRLVLSCVMGFFDPLGLLTPFTVHGKVLVQDLWRTGCGWDETIDDECFTKWTRWVSLLPEVEAARIPRCYLGDAHSASVQSLELHVFTDASEHAYGCVAYFRAMFEDHVRCSLVMSRTKVAPLKRQSIPRLELMAAVLGSRLLHTVEANHSFAVNRRFLWTDSQTVLSWIRSDQHNYKQFVAFRIGEILELTRLADWRWIPSKKNIADVLTKWGQGPPLDSEGQWFNGPQFLYEPEDRWPTAQVPVANTPEEMRTFLLSHNTKLSEPAIDVKSISRWIRLMRVTACALRFISNCRRKRVGLPIETLRASEKQQQMLRAKLSVVHRPLQQEEFEKAECILWRQAQCDDFPDEVSTLRKNRDRKHGQSLRCIEKSSILYQQTPFIDEEGVIRKGGRLENASYAPFDKRFPIILPKGHEVTKRLLQHYHEKFGHANRETVFNELRQRFFIPNLRAAIMQVMKKCMWCRVNRCRPRVPMMAPLPAQRVTPQMRPFSSVGVDYLGPVEVTVGRRKEKRWVALFTCLAVRAVHLEVVHSLTTQACLMAIRRFICKRGAPKEFLSDNGTNFRGASNEIVKMVKRINGECGEQVTNAATKWSFNPPGTPHMGGVWERMVRSVKEAMKALSDGGRLTDEILLTTLSEAEDMVNSRPLTYVPQESAQEEAITPNHFLRGTQDVDVMVKDAADIADALRDTYKRSQYLADRMWQRWYREYLPTIDQRTKWFEEEKALQVGDLVFVVDGKNRKSWTRGIVEEICKGSDGRIRQADVRTTGGVFRRAVVNLALLEVRDGKSGTSEEAVPELRAGECSSVADQA